MRACIVSVVGISSTVIGSFVSDVTTWSYTRFGKCTCSISGVYALGLYAGESQTKEVNMLVR
jgi:hypothetical protein